MYTESYGQLSEGLKEMKVLFSSLQDKIEEVGAEVAWAQTMAPSLQNDLCAAVGHVGKFPLHFFGIHDPMPRELRRRRKLENRSQVFLVKVNGFLVGTLLVSMQVASVKAGVPSPSCQKLLTKYPWRCDVKPPILWLLPRLRRTRPSSLTHSLFVFHPEPTHNKVRDTLWGNPSNMPDLPEPTADDMHGTHMQEPSRLTFSQDRCNTLERRLVKVMAKCDTTKKLFDQLANTIKLPMCDRTLILSGNLPLPPPSVGLSGGRGQQPWPICVPQGRKWRRPRWHGQERKATRLRQTVGRRLSLNVVDQPTGSKMEEMLITWRTGAPNGKERFGVITQLSIEQGICGGYSTSPADASSQSYLNTVSKVQKDGALQANPWDLTAQKHIDQVQPPPSSYPTHPAQSTHIRSHTHRHGAPAACPAYSYQSEQSKSADISTLIPAASSSTLSSPLPLTNIATLYNALLKAGVVSAGGHIIHKSLTRSQTTGNKTAVLSEKVKLTTADILGWVILSWCLLPMQCKQCGLRFSDDLSGKKRMDDHLDMHFRQNSGVGQNVGRGHSRCWFVSLEDWTREAQRDAELRAQFVVVQPGHKAKSIYCLICKETMKSKFLEDDEDCVWRDAVRKDDKIYHATCHSGAVTSTLSLAARLRNDGSSHSWSRTPEMDGNTYRRESLQLQFGGGAGNAQQYVRLDARWVKTLGIAHTNHPHPGIIWAISYMIKPAYTASISQFFFRKHAEKIEESVFKEKRQK
ncbi:hypothetical protein EDC04DRAFT_2600404 [Pisolithus marmoratus]|nr:hypothetical protein EDC04DRAFT_2600404 [Pisolithus marmoratus]